MERAVATPSRPRTLAADLLRGMRHFMQLVLTHIMRHPEKQVMCLHVKGSAMVSRLTEPAKTRKSLPLSELTSVTLRKTSTS
jgi:hypothetical protein